MLKRKTPILVIVTLLAICCLTLPAWAEGLSISPKAPDTANVGENVDVAIAVENATDLGGVTFDLTFDPALLEVVEVKEGNLFNSPFEVENTFDNVNGHVKYSVIVTKSADTFTGSGTAATITFKSKAAGLATLSFSKTQLGQIGGIALPHAAATDAIDIQPEGSDYSEYTLKLDVDYNDIENTVTVSGSLKENNEAVKDVSIGIVIEKDGVQYAFGQILTDNEGGFEKTFSTAGWEAGRYSVTATANQTAKTVFFDLTGSEITKATVVTGNATDIKSSSAVLHGSITDTGNEACDQVKFQYRKQETTQWTDAGMQTGSYGIGDFSFNLTGLSSKTTYEVKAMAHNSAGWSEGKIVTFTTTSSSGGGGGGGGGTTPDLKVDTYTPAEDAKDVALDAVVKVTFDQNITAKNLTKVSIKDEEGNALEGVKATVSGRVLSIAHDGFSYETTYTVSVPKGTVRRSDYQSVENKEIKWSFTTLKEEPKLPPCNFTDVAATHWAANVIKDLCEKGILGGYPDGTFKPNVDVTRAEFTKIIVLAVGLAEENPVTPTFTDVAPGTWYYGYIEAASKAGLVKGYETGEFRPNAKITRQEIAAILVRALGIDDTVYANEKTSFKDDQSIAPWARGSVVVAVKEGLIQGYPDGTFGPRKNATRAETCMMVSRFMEK